MKKAILLSFSILISCGWLDAAEHEKIVKNYEVGWNGIPANRCIGILIGDGISEILVSPYVYAVGNDERFIIAKQHPYSSRKGIDTTYTQYYVIDSKPINITKNPQIFGPMNETAFHQLKKKLSIDKLSFTKNYPENPW